MLVAIATVVVAAAAFLVRPDSPAAGDGADVAAPSAGVAPSTPDVVFERFDGEPVSLADWRGEPLVMNFWASWCPPCVAEMRDAFEPLHRALSHEVTFLGVNLQDTEEAALEVVERPGVTYELEDLVREHLPPGGLRRVR